MKREAALSMMTEVLEGLRRSEMVEPGAPLQEGTVLIGPGAVLDSVGFVTFIAELEDVLNRDRSEPVELILTEIWDFNSENPALTASILADYCARTIQ
jgi:hypothetical protein